MSKALNGDVVSEEENSDKIRMEVQEQIQSMKITAFQERVYELLCQIPPGRVSSYRAMAAALSSAPRSIGGAMKRNPWDPEVPCHRIIAANGYIGGFKGVWNETPDGEKCDLKLSLLKKEGVEFDENGKLADDERWFDDFEAGNRQALEKALIDHAKNRK